MKKRILSLFLSLTLCLTLLPTAAFAEVMGSGTENGTSGGSEPQYVAQIGEIKYETLQDALNKMSEDEITLLGDVTEDITVYAATTIHMGGFSITGDIDATDSLTLTNGTVKGKVTVDATDGTFNMTAPADAAAAIDDGLEVKNGSCSVSGAMIGVKGTPYFDDDKLTISGSDKAVELTKEAEPTNKKLYGSVGVDGDTSIEAVFEDGTYKVGGEVAKKLSNKRAGGSTPVEPASLTLAPETADVAAGETATFTVTYSGTDTLNAYVQENAVNDCFTVTQIKNSDGTYTITVNVKETTAAGEYKLFVHEVNNAAVQAEGSINVTATVAKDDKGNYSPTIKDAIEKAPDGSTITVIAAANQILLPDGIYVENQTGITLDLNGHSLGGFPLNVGGLTATSKIRTGKLTVVDSEGGNGAVGVAVRDGGTLVFDPENDNTTLLQLVVYGGTVQLYGGKILRNDLSLKKGIALGDLLPEGAGLAYYRGDTQLTLEQAASQTCDLVVKVCSHGGENGFTFEGTTYDDLVRQDTCPYCGASAVACAALSRDVVGEGFQWRKFVNLQDALDTARDGGSTLYLLTDVTGDYTIGGTQTTSLDLNGHSIHGTVEVNAVAEGKNYTTTFSNTKNTTMVSIDEVVAHSGAKLAGSGYPAVIGKLWLADTTKWEYILSEPTRLGFKVLNEDGTHKWYAPTDKSMPAPLENVIINSLPITSKSLSFKVNDANYNKSSVERGTTVQLCASCNAKDATVYIYVGEIVGNSEPTYSPKKADYKKIGTNWYYVVDFAANTVGKYSIYFTATKDGYSVTSKPKTLTVTKASIPADKITAPVGNTSLTYNGKEQALVTAGNVDAQYGTMQYSLNKSSGFSTDLPTAKDAGTYTVYYKVKGAEGYKDSTFSTPITVTIAPKELTITGVTFEEKTYDGTGTVHPKSAIFDDDGANSELKLGNYTLGITFDATDAGTSVPFTATVKLEPSVKNYTLPNGTYNGFGEIKKADAPQVEPGTLNVINGTELTYTYDLKQLLPAAPEGKNYGTVSYYCNPGNDISLDSDKGYCLDVTTVEFEDGVLTLVGLYAVEGTATGQVGAVKVKVTTTNYKDITLTLNLNAVNQTKPVADGSITASEITYGDELSKSTISGKMKDPDTEEEVKGTFSWKYPDLVPDIAGTYVGEWKFTPKDKSTYTEATGKVNVTVNNAKQSATLVMSGYTYGETPVTPRLEDRKGKLDAEVIYYYFSGDGGTIPIWDTDNPPKLNAGTYTMRAMIAGAQNYDSFTTTDVKFTVAKATPDFANGTTYKKPNGLTAIYGQTLADVTLSNPEGNLDGEWSWMDSTESVGNASTTAKTFKAKFIPKDTANYNTVENIELEVTVNKADQAALTIQGEDSVVYGQTLTLTTTGGSTGGKVTYSVDASSPGGGATVDENGVLTPTKVGTISVTATMAGNENYNDMTSWYFVISITKATPTGAPNYTKITTSGKTLKDAALTIDGSTLNPNDGELEWVDDKGNVLSDNTVVEANTTYKWRFTPTDTNYTTLTDEVELYHKSSSGGSSGYSYYTIKATAGTGGSISPSGNVSVREGRDQMFTITPDKGYAISDVKIDGKSIGAVKSYTFEKVKKSHTVEVSFAKVDAFADVPAGSYYEEAVNWAVENGITQGTDTSHFSPDGVCTRAQAVTFLWRAAGSPAPKSTAMAFMDIPAGSYYYNAVLWAIENGVTVGTSATTFSPNAICTRAQIVTFLWRAEKSPAAGSSNPFTDVAADAYYADAVLWAVKENITAGTTTTTFSPDDDCTRAQIVTFLYRMYQAS